LGAENPASHRHAGFLTQRVALDAERPQSNPRDNVENVMARMQIATAWLKVKGQTAAIERAFDREEKTPTGPQCSRGGDRKFLQVVEVAKGVGADQ
jgi:hypothetical protein